MIKIMKESDDSTLKIINSIVNMIYDSPRDSTGDDYVFETSIDILDKYMDLTDDDLDSIDRLKSKLNKLDFDDIMKIYDEIKNI